MPKQIRLADIKSRLICESYGGIHVSSAFKFFPETSVLPELG